MAASIESKDCEPQPADAVALDERVHRLPVAGEPVEEDDRRPAAGSRCPVGNVKRGGDLDAVVHRDHQVLLRRGGARCLAGDEDESGRDRR